jgi:hypothetical protein
VKGFWSISVYNQEGFFVENEQDGYVINNVTGKENDDGSTTVFLGACEDVRQDLLQLLGHTSPMAFERKWLANQISLAA